MALTSGTRLGPYEIVEQIGAGGMGEVYRATDTNLKRSVAIKVLPESLSLDAERLARFQREAEVLASLNHPNIAQIFGLEKAEGTIALVMELVDGLTLADRIAIGPIPVDEALAIAKQIAESLEAAHDQGIVHRDLKPANIKVRTDGTVKVLDFGLAKAMDPVRSISPSLSMSPTITTPAMTQAGFILGTAAYMSPEQARGRSVDRRADIWAFGCVLYEMLTGKKAFEAEDTSLTLARILERDVDLGAIPSSAPMRFSQVIGLCLRKDVRQRAQAIGDVRLALDGAFDVTPPRTHGPGPHRHPRWHVVVPFMALVALAGAAIVFLALRKNPPPQVFRFQILAPPGSKLPLGTPAFSPDGRTIAYAVTDPDGINRIHIRPIDRVETRVLPGTDNAIHPFFSPDGKSIGFATVPANQLKRTDLDAGSPRTLAAVTSPWHGTWNQQGTLLLMPSLVPEQMPAEGGPRSKVVALDEKSHELTVNFPEFLSDGQRFLVKVNSLGHDSIQVGTLGSMARTMVLDNVNSAPLVAHAPNGKAYLLFMRAPDLLAQEFDEASATLRGSPSVIVSDIGQVGNPPLRATVGVSSTGILAYQTGGVTQTPPLVWRDRTGAEVGRIPASASVNLPQLSPDGRFLTGSRLDIGTIGIWVTDLERGATTRISFGGNARESLWSPDGTKVIYRRNLVDTSPGIFEVGRDGSGDRRVMEQGNGRITSWSRDGRYLLTAPPSGLLLRPLDPKEKPIEIASRSGRMYQGEFSPTGKYLAFTSDESGRDEIYVQAIPPATGRWKVSIDGGFFPRWRGDGQELFFISSQGSGSMMAAGVKLGDTLTVDVPRELFKVARPDLFTTGYAVRADGQRFLVPAVDVSDNGAPITVVLNWWVELK